MLSKVRSILTSLLIVLMVLHGPSPLVWAQAAAPAPEQLDQLLAPVALYPDALLSQITTASTNPQEILDVNAWLQANPGSATSISRRIPIQRDSQSKPNWCRTDACQSSAHGS